MSNNYLFQAVGAFFVNKYYFSLYTSAKSNSTSSITDTYTNYLREFCSGIKSIERCYRKVVDDLHKYCKRSPRFSSLLYSEFIDKFIAMFVPDDYYESLNRTDKEKLLCQIITELSTGLANFAVRPDILRKIIDDHENSKTVITRMLFEESQNILETQRDIIIHSFVKEINQTQDMVSLDLYNSLRHENHSLLKQIEEIKEDYASALSELNDVKTDNEKLRRLVDLLRKTQIILNKNTAPPLPPSLTTHTLQLHETKNTPLTVPEKLDDAQSMAVVDAAQDLFALDFD